MSELSDLPVDAIQRRTLRTLFVATSFARAGLAVVFAGAALVVEDILGAETWSGSAIASATVGTAGGSYWLSSLMNERGRRVGMVLGFSLAFVGCLLAVVGGELATIVILLPGLTLVGVGLAAASLARYAAADLAEPTAKAKAISSVVFAATAGAVGGPTLAGASGRFGESIGLAPLLGIFVLGAGFFAVAGLLAFVFLRPDPLLVANAGRVVGGRNADKPGLADGVQTILASPGASLAVVGLAISTAVMVMVMAMTPLHMRAHGHGLQDVGWVISVHTAGMFAFSPLAGYLSDKLGGRQSLLLASGLLMGATALTALAGEAPPSLMFSGLFLLGLGWSVGFVAGSALLVESVADSSRVSVQGVADFLAAFCSGVSALSAGFVVSMAGFHILSIVALMIAGVLGFAAIAARGHVIPAYGQR